MSAGRKSCLAVATQQKTFLQNKVAGVGGLSETTKYSFRPSECAYLQFFTTKVSFLRLGENGYLLAVIMLVLLKANHTFWSI